MQKAGEDALRMKNIFTVQSGALSEVKSNINVQAQVGEKSGNLGNVSAERTLDLICAVMGNHGRMFC